MKRECAGKSLKNFWLMHSVYKRYMMKTKTLVRNTLHCRSMEAGNILGKPMESWEFSQKRQRYAQQGALHFPRVCRTRVFLRKPRIQSFYFRRSCKPVI